MLGPPDPAAGRASRLLHPGPHPDRRRGRGAGHPGGGVREGLRPFYRLERSRSRDTGGVGLGLSTARTIIRGHGGDITLANRPGGGLRVTVTLPR
ncbi:ATP-binding protein [Azospirillum thermophilum]|uniref:ATP-binding protein n=1 Tax=Azospirillum thermophilum TaxID=2202148 RepID=UPI001FE72306|nr:ATP-binding protein [Azospirillum thermophilum]